MHISKANWRGPWYHRTARTITVLAFICSAAFAQLPLTTDSEIFTTVNVLNVRDNPGTASAAIVDSVVFGDRGTVINATPHWADGFWWWQVRFHNGPTGWVAQGYENEPLIALWDPSAPRSALPVESPPAPSQPSPATRSGSGVRAWQSIEFGESRSDVAAKVSALYESRTVQSDSALAASLLLNLRANIAGVNTELYFVFDDNRLHEVWFQSPTLSRSMVELDYDLLRDVQIAAHGQPTTLRRFSSLQPERRFIQFGEVWRRGDVVYRLGLGLPEDAPYGHYYAALIIEWEALSQEIIHDAADGF